jgi:hypothetical protein
MDHLAHYEYLVAARGPLFDRVSSLSTEWFLVGQIGGESVGDYPFASERCTIARRPWPCCGCWTPRWRRSTSSG